MIIANQRSRKARKQTIRLIIQERLDAAGLIRPPSSTGTKVMLEAKPDPIQRGTKARGQSAGKTPERGKTGNVSTLWEV